MVLLRHGDAKGKKLDAKALKARRLEARRLKTSRQSASRWSRQPPKELARVRRQGRKAQLDESARAKLKAAIVAGPSTADFVGELWTVPRARQMILQRFGLRFSAVHVWRLLGQLDFSL